MGKSTPSPRTFSFLDPLPRQELDQEFRLTPLWPDAPPAPAVAMRYADPGTDEEYWHWYVVRCPICGSDHMHRATNGLTPEWDPRAFLGGRKAHCARADDRWWLNVEYRLVGIEWVSKTDGALPSSLAIDELDRFFPIVPRRWEARLPHSKTLVIVERLTEGRIEIIDPNERTPAARERISPELRSAVWRKSDGICWYCGDSLDPFLDYHVDHIRPVANGGGTNLSNLAPACRQCNQAKHAMSLEAFRARRGGGLFWFEVARMGGAS